MKANWIDWTQGIYLTEVESYHRVIRRLVKIYIKLILKNERTNPYETVATTLLITDINSGKKVLFASACAEY